MKEDVERMRLEMEDWGRENVLVFNVTVERLQPSGALWTDEAVMKCWNSWARNKLAGKKYFRLKERQPGTGNLHFHGGQYWEGIGKDLRMEVVRGVPRYVLRAHGGKPKAMAGGDCFLERRETLRLRTSGLRRAT